MSIETNKLMNLGDGQILYNDLRNRMDNQKLTGIKDTPADIQSFSDAARFPMELKVGIDPVQDLHGYSNPWPGGGGKNLFDISYFIDRTSGGITSKQMDDGTIHFTGTNQYNTRYSNSSDSIPLPAGTYHISGSPNEARAYMSDTRIDTNGTFTLSSSSNIQVCVLISSGTAVDFYEKIQIESGTTATDWEPYSNICPISGWDGANVSVTGKNILNKDDVSDYYVDKNGKITASANFVLTGFIKVDDTFTISGYILHNYVASMCFYDENKRYISGIEFYKTNPCVCELPSNAKYIRVSLRKELVDQMQIEYGTEATPYEPFGTIYSITFPSESGTVYGGELTIHSDGSGELVVDKGVFDMGNATWTLAANNQLFRANSPVDSAEIINGGIDGVCSCYSNAKGITYENFIASNGTYKINDSQYTTSAKYIIIRDTSVSDAASFKTKMAGQTIVYDLATPITYSLTPGQVFAILGTNNVWADCGQISYVEYVRDTVGEVIPNRFDGIEQDIVDTNTYEKTISEANAIQSFEDGAEWPMGMQIAVDPVQNLHGYDHPWPAGGGKNLLHNTRNSPVTSNGVTATVNSDGTSMTLSGTSNSSFTFVISSTLELNAGVQYALNGCPSGGNGISTYNLRLTDQSGKTLVSDYGSGATYTPSEDITVKVIITVYNGTAFGNGKVFYPMVRLASDTDSTFVPYSNICPISGFTGANVTVTGKNLWSGFIAGKYWTVDGTETTRSENTYAGTNKFRITGNMNFKLFSDTLSNGTIAMQCFDENDGFIEEVGVSSGGTTTKDLNVPLTLPSGTEYVAFRSYRSSVNGGVSAYITAQIMLSYEEASEYEAYKGTTYPIAFPTSAGTVYGGTLTVNPDGTGELVVTHESLTPNASDYNWNSTYSIVNFTLNAKYQVVQTPICSTFRGISAKTASELASSYPGCCATSVGLGFININSNFATLEEFKAYATTNPITFVLKLATPVTYTLTPGQVLSLIGKNHVWADCGDILSLTYNSKQGIEFIREDTAGQINTVVNPVKEELADAESAMAIVVDGDTAPKNITSGQYVFVKNHSTLATGMYHATAAISSGASITGKVEADADGGFNALNSDLANIVTWTEETISIGASQYSGFYYGDISVSSYSNRILAVTVVDYDANKWATAMLITSRQTIRAWTNSSGGTVTVRIALKK